MESTNKHCNGPVRSWCIDCRRERSRESMRATRAADAEFGGSARVASATRRDRVALAWSPFASIVGASASAGIVFPVVADRGRMIVRVARHTIGGIRRADGSVLIARVPRSESTRSRDVARDRTWRMDSIASPVHECDHAGGHEATHSHGAPLISARMRYALDYIAGPLTPGNDPARVAERSVIGECAALATLAYAPLALIGAAWIAERDAHVNGTWRYDIDENGRTVRVRERERCPECAAGELQTTWTNAGPDERPPLPRNRATRDAARRMDSLTGDGTRGIVERATRDWARLCAIVAMDRRIAEYDERERA